MPAPAIEEHPGTFHRSPRPVKLAQKFGIDSHEREQRAQFIHISNEDIALLKELRPIMEQHVDQIVETFYAHLLSFADTQKFFADAAMIARVKATQREYLLDLCKGNLDEAYYERRLQIGIVHERIGVPPKWYIGSYSNFMRLIFPVIAKKFRMRPRKLVACILALVKVMNLDQQLAIDTYVASTAEKLQQLGKQIEGAVNIVTTYVGEIQINASQVAASAMETSAAISETTTTLEEVKLTSHLAHEKALAVSRNAQTAAQVSEKGRSAVEKTLEGMSAIERQMKLIGEGIEQVSQQSHAIAKIVASVNELAEQSNLLAVNAAIEAASAGQHGRGFAVVAQEVRSLSVQSKQATAQVRVILSDIQKAVVSAVRATEQGHKAVEAGVRQSTDAGEALKTLASSVDETAQASIQIAASSQQQLAGVEQVALAMENIRQASTKNAEGTRSTEKAAGNLRQLSGTLKELVQTNRI
jgi:methyl-accepting chemotaxis protein